MRWTGKNSFHCPAVRSHGDLCTDDPLPRGYLLHHNNKCGSWWKLCDNGTGPQRAVVSSTLSGRCGGGIDPSLFFDEDGKCYYVGTRPNPSGVRHNGDWEIWIEELDLHAMCLKGAGTAVWKGALKRLYLAGGTAPLQKRRLVLSDDRRGRYGTGTQHQYREKQVVKRMVLWMQEKSNFHAPQSWQGLSGDLCRTRRSCG